MSHSASLIRSSVIALLLAAACSRPDAAKPAAAKAASGGEVVPTASATGLSPQLNDSISTRADAGRIKGSASAPIWLVEISDFQCPYCKQWHDETFAAIDKEFVQTGKVRLAYLNYPIPSLHVNATAAAEAAMCASVQGKFWEMHDSLFGQQEKWAKLNDPVPVFAAFAASAGVDSTNWNACMKAHAARPLIDADHERSSGSGVQSTPTFFVGKRMILGALPLDTFRVAINAELAKAAKPAP